MKTMQFETIQRILLLRPLTPEETNENSEDSEHETATEYSDSANGELE